MTYNVILTQDNIINNENTKLQYNFPSTLEFKGDQVALAQINMAVSWVNVSPAYNNSGFVYYWYDALGLQGPFIVNYPSGFYLVDEFSAYFKGIMTANGHFLIDPNGDVYNFVEFVYNSTQQRIEIRSEPIPTALPLGWSNPAGMTFPPIPAVPIVGIPATAIQELLGFDAGFYPPVPQGTTYNALAQNTANITPVNTMIVLCSLINNSFQFPNNILFSFVPEGSSGFPTQGKPPEYMFIDIQDGFYSSFTLELVNQDFKTIAINDPQIFVNLVFKKRTETKFLK